MYSKISDTLAEKIMSDSRTFRCSMEFEDGTQILDNIMSVTMSAQIPEQDIMPGMVICSGGTAEIADPISDISGKNFSLYLFLQGTAATDEGTVYADISDMSYSELSAYTYAEIADLSAMAGQIPMGRFTVTSCKKQSDKWNIEAHDGLYGSDSTFTTGLTFPAKSSAVEQEICNALGILYDKSRTAFDITLKAAPDSCTYREMLGFIACLDGGKCAVLDREGYLVHRKITDSGMKITPDRADEPETEQSAIKVTQLICTVSDTKTLTSGENPSRAVTFTNPYMTQKILDTIAKDFIGLEYTPLTVNHRLGDPRFDILDSVTVSRVDGEEFVIPLTNISLSYDGGLTASLAAEGTTDSESNAGTSDGPMTRNVKKIVENATSVTEQTLKDAFAESIDYITGAKGGYHYQKFNSDGYPIADYWADNLDIEKATNIIMINQKGILGTSGGFDGSYDMAITNDGRINASQILTGKLTSITLQSVNYSTSDNTGTMINLNNGKFSFAGGKLTYDGSTLDINGKITADSGTIGGWTIGTTKLYQTRGDYTVVLANYANTDAESRVLHCQYGDENGNDTFALRRNGELRVGLSKDNQLRIQSGHIDFYYNDTKSGRLGQTADGMIAIEGTDLYCYKGLTVAGGDVTVSGGSLTVSGGNLTAEKALSVSGTLAAKGDIRAYGSICIYSGSTKKGYIGLSTAGDIGVWGTGFFTEKDASVGGKLYADDVLIKLNSSGYISLAEYINNHL